MIPFMRNNLLDQEIRERLLSYINGELDEEERLSVESWLRNKPENREAFRLLEKDCLFIRWAGREREVNVDRKHDDLPGYPRNHLLPL